MNLNVYAFPVQSITFQVTTDEGEQIKEINCWYDGIVTTALEIKKELDITSIYVIGPEDFIEPIQKIVSNIFELKVQCISPKKERMFFNA